MTKHPVLDLEMGENDAGAKTIRHYFQLLLTTLVQEKEGFSGKRPFGNSGWDRELYVPLIKAHIIPGELDEDGYIAWVDSKLADELLCKIIKLL
jgi:hypothetical protein